MLSNTSATVAKSQNNNYKALASEDASTTCIWRYTKIVGAASTTCTSGNCDMSRAGCRKVVQSLNSAQGTLKLLTGHFDSGLATSTVVSAACTSGSLATAGQWLQLPCLQLSGQQLCQAQQHNPLSHVGVCCQRYLWCSTAVISSQRSQQQSQENSKQVTAADSPSAVSHGYQRQRQRQQPHDPTISVVTDYAAQLESDKHSRGSSRHKQHSRRDNARSGSRTHSSQRQQTQTTASPSLLQARRTLAAHCENRQPIPEQQQQSILQELAGAAAASQNLQEICNDLHLAHVAGCDLGSSSLQQPMSTMLNAALNALMRDLPTTTASTIKLLLGAYEVARAAVPPQALKQIIDHMVMLMESNRASRFDAFRLFRSATYTRLHLQEDVLQRLLLPLLSDPSVRPASLLKVIQSASYCGQPISQDLAIKIVDKILEAPQQQQQPDDVSQTVSKTVPDSTTSTESFSTSSCQLSAQQSASLLKAVNCLGLSLPQRQVKRLLQPLLHQVLVLDNITYIPSILISMSRMSGVRLPVTTVKTIMMKATAALNDAATAAQVRRRPYGKVDPQLASSSSCMSTSLLIELLKAVSFQQQRLPPGLDGMTVNELASSGIYLPLNTADLLTDSFLDQQPSVQEVSGYLAALAGTTFWDKAHDGSLELHKGRLNPKHMLAVQQQLQQQQQQLRLRASEVGNLLWSVSHMGYCLPGDLMIRLIQDLLDDAESATSYHVTQAMWAISAAAPTDGTGSTDQQQQQELAVEGLLQQLTSLLIKQYQTQKQQQRHQQQCWQLSLAAWTIALCDAQSCKDLVFDIAVELSQPSAWQSLRASEHVQLLAAHQWLCDYQWTVDHDDVDGQSGLSRVFTAEQMHQMVKSRQDQVADQSEQGTKNLHAAFNQRPISRAAQVTQKLQGLPSWQDVVHFTPDSWDMRPHQQIIKQQQQQGSRQQHSMTSINQANLFVSVCRLPYIKSACLERVTADGLFSIDIAAETKEGQQLAIEFDGPWHYKMQVLRQQQQHEAARPAPIADTVRYDSRSSVIVRDVVTRSTVFRNRALAARGFHVVPVYYQQWPGMNSHQQQKEAAHKLITAVLGPP